MLALLRPARGRLVTAVVLGLLITVTYVLQGLLVAIVIDRALVGAHLSSAIGPVAGIAGLLLVRATLFRWREIVGAVAAATVTGAVRHDLYSKLLAMGPSYGMAHRTGESVSTLVDAVEALDPYVSLYVPQFATSVIGAVGVIIAIGFVNPLIGLIVALCSLAVAFLPRLVRRTLRARRKDYWGHWRALGSDYLDAVQGVTTLKALGVSGEHGASLYRRSHAFYRASIRMTAVSNVGAGAVSLVASAGTAVTVGVGVVLTAEGQLSVFRLLVVLLLSREALRPLTDLQNAFHATFGVPPAADAIFAVLNANLPVQDFAAAATVVRPPAVEFDDVVFAYRQSGRPALDHFNMSIAPGETVALVGRSGAGKTTAVSLLQRFFDVDAGAVRIGGTDIREMPLGALRAAIAVVAQDTYLFHGTVAENIAFGRAGATNEEIVASASAANAHEFITAMPEGYQTMIGERGLKLSGGERQRIAIARAVLKDAPLLVLDEATSSIDVAGERTVQDALLRLREGRTTIVIAHRLSAIESVDRSITLFEGRTHDVDDHVGLLSPDRRRDS